MNPLLEVLCNEITKIKKMLTTTGSDYTATVTKVEGDTAYVQIAGSDISDTPVALSINADVGDRVRVRVANGKAWITGNDSSPPTDDTKAEQAIQETRAINERINNTEKAADGRYSKIEQTVDQITLEVGAAESKADTAQTTANTAQTTANGRMKADMSNKASSITINSGLMAFLANTLKIDSTNFKLDENGNATFSGTLNAAKGRFEGDLVIHHSRTNSDVKIGTSWSFPIYLESGSTSLSMYSGAIHLDDRSAGGQMCDVTKDSVVIDDGVSRSATLDKTGVHTSSDIRLKEDITKIDPETAKHLLPVKFRFKGDDKIHYGFIAQDVQKVIPDVVQESEDGYLTLTYHELIAPLYALVQEQEDRINRLEARIEQLEKGE